MHVAWAGGVKRRRLHPNEPQFEEHALVTKRARVANKDIRRQP